MEKYNPEPMLFSGAVSYGKTVLRGALQESQIKVVTFTSRLNDLMSMGLVGRIQAEQNGERKSTRITYFTNSMFHFWYRYVYKY